MTGAELFENIKKKGSFLCVGLDTDLAKIPRHLLTSDDPIFEFNRAIIDATAEFTVAYKPNLAFYEYEGAKGWESFMKTCLYIRKNYPEIFIIADAKRGDIGNTSQMYAEAFFADDQVDAVTLSPYMGRDTVEPFLQFRGKWAVILALTSNKSAEDFETLKLKNGRALYEEVLEVSKKWGSDENMMYVVGATQAKMLEGIRKIVPNHFLLIPGVGAQGGSIEQVARYGMNARCGLLVNSSRAIIYASEGENFAEAAANEAKQIAITMSALLKSML